MGKDWDYNVPSVKVWQEIFRVLKPGAYLLSFFGTRTYHRGVVNIEDAGFEVKDMILWIYGSGFPKSTDISKAIDKEFKRLEEREIIGVSENQVGVGWAKKDLAGYKERYFITSPATPEAQKWQGFGTALKPACEPIVLAKKPISEHNIAQNVLKWGTGGLNIDRCRVAFQNKADEEESKGKNQHSKYKNSIMRNPAKHGIYHIDKRPAIDYTAKGRFPANIILECCCEDSELIEGKEIKSGNFPKDRGKTAFFGTSKEHDHYVGEVKDKVLIHTNPNCVCRMLDEQSGVLTSHGGGSCIFGGVFGNKKPIADKMAMERFKNDRGGASRFFYQAKASQNERWFYCKICKQAHPMKERDNHIHNPPDNTRYQHLEFSSNSKTVRTHTIFS